MALAAFDLEIAKEIPDDDRDWLRHGPIGISCAAFVREGADSAPLVMFDPGSSPDLFDPATKAITRHGAGLMVEALANAVQRGFTIVTWNGLGFDFPLLAPGGRKRTSLAVRAARLGQHRHDVPVGVSTATGCRSTPP